MYFIEQILAEPSEDSELFSALMLDTVPDLRPRGGQTLSEMYT